ncbi:hypothetical protein ACJ73_09922, partial [Blastomyces percursus]
SAKLLHLQARSTHRQSILMWLKGDIKGSESTIKLFLSSLNTEFNDPAWCEDLGALYLSQAMNHVYNFSFVESHREVRKWMSIADLPGGQERLLWDLIFCVGCIMRGEGQFEGAELCFNTCLRTPELRESKRFLVQSTLADLYCELGYLHMKGQAFYLSLAKAVVEPEIERNYWDADLLTRELIMIYDNLREPDIVDRLGHVRALIAFARVAPTPEDALKRWEDVLLWNGVYNPLEEEVFTCGVVYLFLCVTWYKLGDIDKGADCFQNAMQVIERKQRQFLIPGMGTYLFHDVRNQIQSIPVVGKYHSSLTS